MRKIYQWQLQRRISFNYPFFYNNCSIGQSYVDINSFIFSWYVDCIVNDDWRWLYDSHWVANVSIYFFKARWASSSALSIVVDQCCVTIDTFCLVLCITTYTSSLTTYASIICIVCYCAIRTSSQALESIEIFSTLCSITSEASCGS